MRSISYADGALTARMPLASATIALRSVVQAGLGSDGAVADITASAKAQSELAALPVPLLASLHAPAQFGSSSPAL
jgi:hypothetical protein